MEKNEISAPVFALSPDWSRAPEYELSHRLWAEDYPAFWPASVQLCAVKGQGIYARMKALEPSFKAVFSHRDDPVWQDSCLEFFMQPFADDSRYLNIEINPNCAWLSAVGSCRNDRVSVSSLCTEECAIKPLAVDGGWGVEIFVPNAFVSAAFSRKFCAEGQIKANFYKCGDETEFPHYSSLFHVGSPTPDFHTPQYFGAVNFTTERD